MIRCYQDCLFFLERKTARRGQMNYASGMCMSQDLQDQLPSRVSKTSNVTVCFIFKALPSSDCLKLFPALENCLLGSKYFGGQHLCLQIEGKHQPKYIHQKDFFKFKFQDCYSSCAPHMLIFHLGVCICLISLK